MITDKTIKALKIIDKYGVIYPKQFAQLMWPDSPAWDKVYNTGINGATSGKGMWLCAGSYLRKLKRRGLVEMGITDYCQAYYVLSKQGRGVLKGESQDE